MDKRKKKNLQIREQKDAKQNLENINKKLFRQIINHIYNDNENVINSLLSLGVCKILGKMVIENIFSYDTEKELNKVFEKISLEIISDIKDKNKYKNQYILFNGMDLSSSELYPKIVKNFYNIIKKYICKYICKDKENKENEDLE